MANRLSIAGFVVGVAVLSAPLFAHHGAASFDSANMVTVKGTVTEYVWSNPHVLVKVDVKDEAATSCTGFSKHGIPSLRAAEAGPRIRSRPAMK